MQVHLELDMEGISQLVSGNWPLLETLVLTLTDVNELVFSTIVAGDWPMLKKLHIDIKGNAAAWDRQRVDSWQTIEQECYNVCNKRLPFFLPLAPAGRAGPLGLLASATGSLPSMVLSRASSTRPAP